MAAMPPVSGDMHKEACGRLSVFSLKSTSEHDKVVRHCRILLVQETEPNCCLPQNNKP